MPASPEATLGFIGGTGPQGRGLALRFALAGIRCLLGSRERGRAVEAAEKVRAKVDGALDVTGGDNDEVAHGCDVAFVVVPYSAQRATLAELRGALADKVVISCVNALGFDAHGPHPLAVPDGSAAEEVAALLPRARVAAAFQNVSAATLNRPSARLDADVLVTADDTDVRSQVVALADRIAGLRGIDAGPLRLSRPIEEITAVLLAVNARYDAHAGLRLAGVDPVAD